MNRCYINGASCTLPHGAVAGFMETFHGKSLAHDLYTVGAQQFREAAEDGLLFSASSLGGFPSISKESKILENLGRPSSGHRLLS